MDEKRCTKANSTKDGAPLLCSPRWQEDECRVEEEASAQVGSARFTTAGLTIRTRVHVTRLCSNREFPYSLAYQLLMS